jgi:hypothetical protein
VTGVICLPALVLFKMVFRISYSRQAGKLQARARRHGKLAGTPARAK